MRIRIRISPVPITHTQTNLVDVRGAELGFAGAELRQVTLVFGVAAHHSRRLGPARLEVAALPRPARRVRPQTARRGVAAGIVAMLAQPAISISRNGRAKRYLA
jgi:hypothetical protein